MTLGNTPGRTSSTYPGVNSKPVPSDFVVKGGNTGVTEEAKGDAKEDLFNDLCCRGRLSGIPVVREYGVPLDTPSYHRGDSNDEHGEDME